MEKLFVQLYPLVALLSVGGYIPQIVKLARARMRVREDGISLRAWILWIGTNFISLGYGVFHLRDPLFIATVCASLVSMTAVAGLIVYNRYIRPLPPV